MRWSKMFIPTLRESPAKEALPPLALMARAGFVRVQAGRITAYLPLGQRSIRKIEELIRETLVDAGGQEFSLRVSRSSKAPRPKDSAAPVSASESNLAEKAPTAPGLFDVQSALWDIASTHLRSYRELPQSWFSFGLHGSPSSGAYENCCFSATISQSGEVNVRDLLWSAFSKLIEESGLNFLIASAARQARRETAAEERVALSPYGALEVALCPCGYTADLECAVSPVKHIPDDQPSPGQPDLVETPGKKTIGDVAEFLAVPPASIIKSLLYIIAGEPVLVLVLGSDQLNESLLCHAVASTGLRPAGADEVKKIFGTEPGSIGPVGQERIRILADHALRGRRNMVCGANKDDYHLTGVQPEKHFHAEYFDLRRACDKDPCPNCDRPLSVKRAHLLMRSSALQTSDRKSVPLRVLGPDDKLHPVSATIHIFYLDTLLLSLVEQFSDNDGIVLPHRIAPFDVLITPVNYRDKNQTDACNNLHGTLTDAGFDVLLDDRDSTPGVKFKDADLIGVPLRITVGPKKLKEGMVELRSRKTRESFDCSIEEAAQAVARSLAP